MERLRCYSCDKIITTRFTTVKLIKILKKTYDQFDSNNPEQYFHESPIDCANASNGDTIRIRSTRIRGMKVG